ncbi:PepSY-associated TM helix domain-containing protein [Trinickia sp. EG282A]|uniref:PepSY-associated TM helix domain-containing protein n=1 Tax=Trinickia sp. EG282A TaxID=3237013 RepID=UPI0034D2414C
MTTNNGYRTLWRWHFYAGLFVMPLLIVLAVTGTLYCFQPQIERVIYRDRLVVEPQAQPRLPEEALLARAAGILPKGAVASSARIANDPTLSAEFIFRLPDGERESVYVNPYTGAVLGTLSVEHRFMQIDRMLHRKLMLGKPGELLMELAACWTLVMIGTGIALWWPREGARAGRQFWPDFSMKGRALWKSVHAVLGVWLAVGALAFIVTGLPWTGSWGKQFKSLATSANLGAPPGAWGGLRLHSQARGGESPSGESANAQGADHAGAGAGAGADASRMGSMPGMTMDDMPLANVPWAVGAVPVPRVPAHAHDPRARLPLDRLVEDVRRFGLTDAYEIAFPQSPDGVYTVTYFPPDPRGERTLYLDQYSGAVLKDIRYRDYGVVAKAISFGTSLHMGRYFGLANQIVCTLISLGLAAMAVTGCVMWWKRRPVGKLGAPGREHGMPPMHVWKVGLALLGILFPLMGASLVAVWVTDRALFGRPGER